MCFNKNKQSNNGKLKNNEYFSDSPIKINNENDELGTEKIIKQIESIIEVVDVSEESYVIGLQGAWGSGKSSILKSLNFNENDYIVFNYSPRIYGNEVNLYEKFFDELAKYIGSNKFCSDKSIKKDFMEYKLKIIGKFADKFNNFWISLFKIIYKLFLNGSIVYLLYTLQDVLGFKKIFYIIGLFFIIASIVYVGLLIKMIINKYNLWRYYKNYTTIDEVKNTISRKLFKLNKKVIIIIDDIDRLKSDKISSILQLVKSTANFKNTIYILSYDKGIIERALKKEYNLEKNYLEKFIQMEITLPKTSYYGVPNIFLREFNKFLDDIHKNHNQTKYILSDEENRILLEFLRSQKGLESFNTIRKIKKFLNSLKCDFNLIQKGNKIDEINIVDFTLLEIIKINDNKFYNRINNEIGQLIFNFNFKGDISNDLKNKIDTEVLKLFPDWHNIFYYLFKFNNYGIIDQGKFRICNRIYFEKYFSLDVLDTGNSDFYNILQNIIYKVKSDNEIINEINDRYHTENFLTIFMNTIIDNNINIYPRQDILKILIFLINHEKKLKQFNKNDFYSLSSVILKCIHQFFQNITSSPNEYKQYFLNILKGIKEYSQIIDFTILSLNTDYTKMKSEGESDSIINRLKQEHNSLGKALVEELNNEVKQVFLKLFNANSIHKNYNRQLILKNGLNVQRINKNELFTYLEKNNLQKDFCDKMIFGIKSSLPEDEYINSNETIKIINECILHYFTKNQMLDILNMYYKTEEKKYNLGKKALEI